MNFTKAFRSYIKNLYIDTKITLKSFQKIENNDFVNEALHILPPKKNGPRFRFVTLRPGTYAQKGRDFAQK